MEQRAALPRSAGPGPGRDPVSEAILGAAIEVHRELGPGLLESAYQACLAREFESRSISFRREVQLPVVYKGARLDVGYRLDFVVEESVVVEVKAVEAMKAIHEAQMLTYLRLSPCRVGLLLNFHAPTLKSGVKRLIV